MQPPVSPACRARPTAGKTWLSSGSNSQVDAVEKSQAAATAGTRSGQPSASAMGSFMSGGRARAIVEASVGNAEQQVGFDELEPLVDQRRRVQGVLWSHRPGRMRAGLLECDVLEVGGRPAAEGPARGGEHQLGDLVGASA